MINKSGKLSQELADMSSAYLDASTIHAVPFLVKQSESCAWKSVWLCCFLVSVSGCAWFLNKSVHTYLANEVVSKTDIKYETDLVFPMITICDLNPFATSYARAIIDEK